MKRENERKKTISIVEAALTNDNKIIINIK